MGRQRTSWPWVVAVLAGFVAWALTFIARHSFIAIDGQRYFPLFDDAMVSLRYGWNLAHGQGLVWNPTERIEGFSNPLMVALMAACAALLDLRQVPLAVQLIGLTTMLAVCLRARALAGVLTAEDGPEDRGPSTLLALLAVALYYPSVYMALAGMETALVTLWLLGATSLAIDFARGGDRRAALGMALYLGLGYLTRADSVVSAVLLFAYAIAARYRVDRSLRAAVRPCLSALALYALFVAGYGAFRWGYYGEWVPNTYTLKLAGVPLPDRLLNGFTFVQPFVVEHAPIFAVAGLGALLGGRGARPLLFGLAWLLVAYQIWVGGDITQAWRMLSPGVVLLLVLVACETPRVAAWCLRKVGAAPSPLGRGALAALATVLCVAVADLRYAREIAFEERDYMLRTAIGLTNAGLALREVTGEDATLAVVWAGAVPYYAGRRSFDVLGKADARVARLAPDLSGAVAWWGMTSVPGHNKYDLQYSIVERQPTYVQMFQWGRQDVRDWASSRYAPMRYGAIQLALRRGDPRVRWERLTELSAQRPPR